MKYSYTAAVLAGMVLSVQAATDPGVALIDSQCQKICETSDNACRTMPGANISTCNSELARCKTACRPDTNSSAAVTSPTKVPDVSTTLTTQTTAPTSSSSGGGDQCVTKCQTAENECRVKPGANISTCVSDFEACKAACSPSSSMSSSSSAASSSEAATTSTAAPTKTASPTTAQTAAPTTTGSASTPLVTAGSSKMYPAVGLIFLCGVAAFL
ncbi:hypothetical protein JDV02_010685 [Purpureocillium takamizusanense]|uniref:Uncharacterized protein n=1 Tax=Purpureocillium takamizusanense TaxID=2060973 RepID=A0A9Q8QT68_9HYPO|nr:uncharacterized protein JDV02_010685 [Purpureocillium takamizusanense]UNI24972.1 hypothetical protein JDV02_010685 [Purpureocillium takamizusanense]